MRCAQADDIVILVNDRDKRHFVRMLTPGKRLETHRGVLEHDALIGTPIGSIVRTHLGHPYYLLLATTAELVENLKRQSQIVYPKDSGYLLLKMGVKPGARVVEAGCGSGGMTVALATMVGDDGHVYAYDVREDMISVARQNLKRIGLYHRVTFVQRDAAEGFDVDSADAVFLDMQTPWGVLDQARAALRGGGVLGTLVPTVNQLQQMVETLQGSRDWGFVEAEELVLRPYKVIPARVRPDDQMVGHTGFLIFARAIVTRNDLPLEEGADSTAQESDG